MAETKSQIAFEELGLGSVLKQYRLRVPPNQREYAWTDREVMQLLEDFAKAITDDGPYFLGTIVTIPRGEDEGLEVVDGQQRLATTALLLAAIRDYLSEKNEAFIVESINNEFLTGIDRSKRVRIPKLRLNIDDNDLFSRIVVGNGDTPAPLRSSHRLLLTAHTEAQKHVRKLVGPLGEKEHGNVLNRWVSFIEHRALIVLLKVPNDADAYKMFETLNDRGLRTSQADLIKNYLFSRSGERIAEVQSRWSFMRGALETLDDEDITITFLRHALIVQRGLLREADIYDAVQDIANSEQSSVSLTSILETLANVYVETFNPEHERWNSYPRAARKAIEVFNLFNIRPMRPLILATAFKMDKKETSKVFKYLISLGVRLIIASNTRSGSVEKPLAFAAKDVFEGTIETANALQEALSALMPTDQEFRTAFETAKVSNARIARYYLRSLEMSAKGESEPWFVPHDDQQVINLEHVLPRRPEDNWPSFAEDDVHQYANRLGNLALLRASDNSGFKSEAFAFKRQTYAASPYVLTSQIGEVDDWTLEAIAGRQNQLASIAVNTWPAKL
jgi:hypothetical protein